MILQIAVAVACGFPSNTIAFLKLRVPRRETLGQAPLAFGFRAQFEERLAEGDVERQLGRNVIREGTPALWLKVRRLLVVKGAVTLLVKFFKPFGDPGIDPVKILIEEFDVGLEIGLVVVGTDQMKNLLPKRQDVGTAIVVFLEGLEDQGGTPGLRDVSGMHEHNPERRSSFDALTRHYAVARLEDVQRDRLSGKENETQREKWNTRGTHCRVRALTTEDRKRICMCLGSATLLFLQEEYVVQPPSGHATRQRTDPVNRVIRPVIRGEGWTECARRIESRPRERSTEQRRRRDRQTDGKARDLVEGAARINGCSKDNEHEKECHDAFEDHANRG